ncbi:ribbon-helix-helix domain-containing protein [Tenggerimyces flavus]|uniref:CopG family transcriptional regulator n=1 Tax=Tenggerimyces flavus TaxID=1708749 RepID=A0ABV7Y584_9ACTN|nr:CopG family transcriptional regulator [Tenggerimyces flavus]MBM7791090.1 hypothetical protein [Tenggerimyces flavus]
MSSHRLQLLLDEERYERIVTLAKQRKTSVAAVVREAIDRGLPSAPHRRVAAQNRILAAEPMPVGVRHVVPDADGVTGLLES